MGMRDDKTYREVTEKAGGASALARSLGESIQTVINWRDRGFPPKRCKAIEALTGVDVKRLRPDDWADYWPEPTETVKAA
jgi:DNA-binding transcriptional regulator YdaS (Cro superfamily)